MSSRFFFFSSRRRHTRFDCDWSSDVCSSDLAENWWSATDWSSCVGACSTRASFFMLTRRRILLDAGAGFGWLAASWLLQRENAEAAELGAHFAPKVKRGIQVFCVGGMSHPDPFGHK